MANEKMKSFELGENEKEGINMQSEEVHLSAKEVTINYLESIREDRLEAIELCKDDIKSLGAKLALETEVSFLNIAIKLVQESEGE